MIFKAFISYSHAADSKLAPALQDALYRLAKPWYRRRSMRVFRDKTSLSANPALWASIEKALGDSEYFLLLASPEAVESPWIRREVEWWVTHRSINQILILVTEGSVMWDRDAGDFNWGQTNALPRSLQGWFTDEPLYVDLRWARTAAKLSLRQSQFRDAVLDIAATLLSKAKDDIDSDDLRQHRRTKRIAWSAVIMLSLLTLSSIVAARIAMRQRDQAVSRGLAAASLVEFQRDPELGIRLAVEALQVAYTRQSEDAVRANLLQSPVRLIAVLKGYDYQGSPGIAFSPDGRWLVTKSTDRLSATASVWDTATWSRTFELRANSSRFFGLLRGVSVSADSRLVATDSDREVEVWYAERGTEVASHENGSRPIFSPDSQEVATIAGPSVELWDAFTGKTRVILKGHTGDVWSVAFSLNGKWVVTASSDQTARVWEATTGSQASVLKGHSSMVFDAAFSPDDKFVITASADRTARVWDSTSGRCVAELRGHGASVLSALFSPDGRMALTTSDDSTVRLWEARTGRALAVLPASTGRVFGGVFSRDGSAAITAGGGAAQVWDVRRGKLLSRLNGTGGEVYGLAVSPDGQLVAAGEQESGGEGSVRVWKLGTQKEIRVLQGHLAEVSDLAINPRGDLVATASSDRTAALWELSSGRQLALLPHKGQVHKVAFSPNGQLLLTLSDGTLTLWNVASAKAIVERQVDNVRSAHFSPDGHRILTIEGDGRTAQVRSLLSTDSSNLALPVQPTILYDASFSPDGKLIVTVGAGGTVRLWDATTGKLFAEPKGYQPADDTSASFSPDGKRILISDSKRLGLWEISTRRLVKSFPAHGSVARISPDGHWIVTADYDQESVEIWDAAKSQRRSRINYHGAWSSYSFLPNEPGTVSFSPSGHFLAVARPDGTVLVWDLRAGQAATELHGHTRAVTKVLFSPDEQWVATASEDGTARLYPWEMFAPLNQVVSAAKKACRELSSFERTKYLETGE